jgi:DNA (cytosine-5)-methyltransferase 1
MKVLNLFSGIGGNRLLWTDCEVTAVESDPIVAEVYQQRFPADTVIVGDALKYVELRYREFDFIWASPPCQSHGQVRDNLRVRRGASKPVIPEITMLYGLIIFLRRYCSSQWIVENVEPWYQALVQPNFVLSRHLIWNNFFIPHFECERTKNLKKMQSSEFLGHEFVQGVKGIDRRQMLRNQVNSDLGLHIFKAAQVWMVEAI